MSMQCLLPVARLIRSAAFAAAATVCLHAGPALSQSAVGGSIGKQDKSISGGGDDGGGSRSTSHSREREPSRSERSSHSERSSRRERSGGGGGGGGSFDGTWASASAGRTCSDRTSAVVAISGGNMVSDGFTGRVSGSGSVSGVWAGSGLSAKISGHMSGRSGSGTFTRSDGCVGTWTLSKQ
jgi:hypothetical protein